MKRLLSIILVCIMLFATFSIINVSAVSESTVKNELIYLLQYYCWDFDFTPEFWYEIYTKESYDDYLSAKQKADKLIADESTTDEEFENMILEFQTAQKNLVRIDVTIPEETLSATENTESTEKTEVTEITEPTINTNTSSTEPTSISNTTPTKNNSTVDEATTSTTSTISTNSDTVKTGYNQNIFILITLLMCSMGIVIITTIKSKTSK